MKNVLSIKKGNECNGHVGNDVLCCLGAFEGRLGEIRISGNKLIWGHLKEIGNALVSISIIQTLCSEGSFSVST